MASRAEILSSRVTTKAISRVAASTSALLTRFGMAPGGTNVNRARQRTGFYDIFNDARSVGQYRAPGVQSAVARRQVVGQVAYSIPRMAERLPLDYDQLFNQRPIGGQASEIDTLGQSYIARQQRFMGQRAANFRLASLGGMIRGNLYVHEAPTGGDDEYFDYNSANAKFSIDYKIPAGNKDQLAMVDQKGNAIHGTIIDKGWQDPTANIPDHCMKVNSAFQQQSGTRLELACCNSNMWTNLVNNDYLVSQAGIANQPFRLFVRGNEVASNELPNTTFEAVFAAMPWLTWVITDEGIELGAKGSEVYTKFLPDDYVWFGPDPNRPANRDLMEMLEGPEPVSEGPNMAPQIRHGLFAYNVQKYDPASIDLHTLDNALAVLYNPYATAYGHVANF